MKLEEPGNKLRILFRGWFNIPHSYAMVNCFQLLSLWKGYQDRIQFYIEEQPYFNPGWNGSKKLVYSEMDNEIIRSLPVWKGEDIDLVYSITYPYDIEPVVIDNNRIPKCIFYTSEFAWLNEQYFKSNHAIRNVQELKQELLVHPEFYYTAPSLWSHNGLRSFGISDSKNRIITHGVEPSVFYQLKLTDSVRSKIRSFYGIRQDEILLINIGSMTENKGIVLILETLHQLVNVKGYKHYRLLLKGSGDLYESQRFVENYFNKLQSSGKLTQSDIDELLANNIIFTNKTLSYEKINELYNAADYYFSPYLAEGFNLTVLEALSAGLPVIVPSTGSTKEFVEDIYNHGGEKYIHYVPSNIGRTHMGLHQNMINITEVVNVIEKLDTPEKQMDYRYSEYLKLHDFITENYSWARVAESLYDYFCFIHNS